MSAPWHLLWVVAVAGCARAAPVREVAAPSAPPLACVTGTVAVEGVGYAPRAVVRSAEGVTTFLDGAEARRVRLLTGALVTVCGEFVSGDAALEVTSFALRRVDDMEAHLGVLRAVPDGVVLDPGQGQPPVPLSDVPAALGGARGATAWVAGVWRDGRFAVQGYGLLPGW